MAAKNDRGKVSEGMVGGGCCLLWEWEEEEAQAALTDMELLIVDGVDLPWRQFRKPANSC